MKTVLLLSILGLLSVSACSNQQSQTRVGAEDIPGLLAEEKYHYRPKDIKVPLFRDPFWFLNPRYRNTNENK